jgi:hypothetical protein
MTVPGVALAGQNAAERECRYIDMSAVDRGFFTADAKVKAAP